MNIAKKAMQGIAWVALINLMIRAIRFLITLVLARLLTPEDFGLVAIGLLVVNTIALFRDMGMSSALIYHKGEIEKAANTAFILFPIIGLGLSGIAFLSAPYTAAFFSEPHSEPVIKALSVTLFLVSLGITHSSLLDRELEFKKQVAPETVSIVSYGLIAVILAFSGYGVWAIVYGKIFSFVVYLIAMWIVFPWRPKLEFDIESAKSLLGYGRHIMGAAIILFALANLDKAFVGKLVGTTALGFYTMAYTVSNMHVLNINNMIRRVLFPTFSRLGDNPASLKRAFIKTVRYVSLFTAPLSLGILIMAPEIILGLLGEKWMPSLLALQILCIAGLLQAISTATTIFLKATGKPETVVRISLVQLVLFIGLAYPLSLAYGVAGTSIAITFSVAIFMFVGFYKVTRYMPICMRDFLNAIKTPFLSSGIMIFLIAFLRLQLSLAPISSLIVFLTAGCGAYVISVLAFQPGIKDDLLKDLGNLKA